MRDDCECTNSDHAFYARIDAALDRHQEAHWWIHKLDEHYHQADLFRWHLNAFLKAIKEVPLLVAGALQNERGFSAWFRDVRAELQDDPLMSALSKKRDFIVHRGMLVPNSSGFVGITELRGMKFGMRFPVYPLEDSADAMDRYLLAIAEAGDFLGILQDDEDSLPCVERTWQLEEIDGDLVDICARAWQRTGEAINLVSQRFDARELPLGLECRHASDKMRFKLFDRANLRLRQSDLVARKLHRARPSEAAPP